MRDSRPRLRIEPTELADAEETVCYGLRRVNPFQGVVAVVKRPGARALSLDGRQWQIQVLAAAPRGRGGVADEPRYVRFGAWSQATGLARVPVNPTLDIATLVAACEDLIAVLPEAGARVPFALADLLELWLLDQEGAPLALLATALPETDLASVLFPRHWEAGGRGERPFVSASLSQRGVPVRDGSGRRPHVETLEQLVMTAAGRPARRQWFRLESGMAIGLDLMDPASAGSRQAAASMAETAPLAGCRLPRQAFPPFGVRCDWPADADRCLFTEYRAWLAPYLLGLPELAEATRRELEQEAAAEAQLVESLWRLYPAVLDQALFNRIRVEARLRTDRR